MNKARKEISVEQVDNGWMNEVQLLGSQNTNQSFKYGDLVTSLVAFGSELFL